MLLRKQIIAAGLLWLLTGFSNPCLAQENNLRFISSLTDSLFDVATIQLPDEKTSHVILRSLEETDVNWFFEAKLIEFLKGKNISHIYFEEQTEGVLDSIKSSVVFEYQLLKLSIDYNKQIESSNRVRRVAEVSFFLRIIQQGTGKVLLSKKFEAAKEEWIHFNQAHLLPRNDIQFNLGQTKQRKSSILQPILISGITGVIVYSFYALRSR